MLEINFEFLGWGIRMHDKAFGCLNGVFECKTRHSDVLKAKSGCWSGGYLDAWRKHSDSWNPIRMPKRAFGYERGCYTEGIRMLKTCIRIRMKLSGYWKIVFGCLQLQDHEQQTTNRNKTQINRLQLDLMLGNQPTEH